MSKWEVTIKRSDPRSVPPSLYDVKGDVYACNSDDCVVAEHILAAGRLPQATVTDKSDTGRLHRPPFVLIIRDAM